MTRLYRIVTLGCRVNQAESDELAANLAASGWRPAPAKAHAELCVVNTCAVTASASQQSRQAVRQCAHRNPQARLIVTGCASHIGPDPFASIDGVTQVVPNPLKAQLPELIGIQRPADAPVVCAREALRSRPLVKVQEGCCAGCTYCIVPQARGPSRSQPLPLVLEHLGRLGHRGFHEAVLTGTHLGLYGQDLTPPVSLATLLSRIAAAAPIDRLRLSSIEPGEISDELLSLIAHNNLFCHHVHIPLQSGDDGILARMHRPYRVEHYARLLRRVRAALPSAAIGADVMVGFPGESEQAFAATCDLLHSLPVSYLHVFPFSPRPGTPAAGFPHRIAPATIAARCRILRAMGDHKRIQFAARFVGRTLNVLVESRRDASTGRRIGLSDNYLTVLLAPEASPHGGLRTVRITAMDAAGRLIAGR
jgi:threonylcarbamoyladenosine tRNA methylthiotransferase MtaB